MTTRLTSEQSAIVEEWYFLVPLVAGKYNRRLPGEFEDHVSWGTFGLIKAAMTWDPAKADPDKPTTVAWRSWAVTKIRGAILDAYLADAGRRRQTPPAPSRSLDRLRDEQYFDIPYREPGFDAIEDSMVLPGLLGQLTRGQRKVCEWMSQGYDQRTTAKLMGVTEGRVSQIVRELRERAYGMLAA